MNSWKGLTRRIAGAFLLAASFESAYGEADLPVMEDPYDWRPLEAEPLPVEFENAVVGLSDKSILVGNIGEQSDGPHPIHYLDLSADSPEWHLADTTLPAEVSSVVAASPDQGTICAGGYEPGESTDKLFRLIFNREQSNVEVDQLPALPEPLAEIRGAILRGTLYALGHEVDEIGFNDSTLRFYSRSLKDDEEEAKWIELSLPSHGLAQIEAAVPQYNGMDSSLYFFHPNGSVSAYDPTNEAWTALPHALFKRAGTTAAAAVGTATVFLLSQPDPIGEQEFRIYNTITNRWAISPRLSIPSPIHTLISDGSRIWFPVYETGGLELFEGHHETSKETLSGIDYGVLVAYFGLLIAMGLYFSKREKSTLTYFKAGKRIPGWAMGISLTVTSTSAISFISLTAKAFATDWLWFATTLFAFVGAILVYFFFLPFFARLDVTTAYEYLEERFGVVIRSLGGLLFLVSEIFRMGTVTYMPALALSVVTGMDIYLCILLIGVVATVYTLLGGIEAVIWTDVLQTVIMLAGLFCTIGIVFYHVDVGAFKALNLAWDLGKFRTFDFSFSFSIVTIWVVLTTLPVGANPYITNQAFFQRLVTTPNPKETGKGLIVKSIIGPIIILLLFLTGTCLFLFYYYSPGQFNPTLTKPDQILPWFIVVELPIGISGLMIGAIFAASMSSLDSGINSICTVCVNDFYGRFTTRYDDLRALWMAKLITLLMGILGTLIAVLLASAGIKTMIDVYYQYLIIFMGCIGGIYMLGFFTTRGNSWGAFIGFLAAAGVLLSVKANTDVIFFTYGLIATSVGMIVGYLASLVIKGDDKPLDGLTFFTQKNG